MTIQCTTPMRPCFYRRDEQAKETTFIRPNCGQWKCGFCSRVNARQWGERISAGIDGYMTQGKEFWFVTLTSHERLKTRKATEIVFSSAWRKIYARMKRKARVSMVYVAIPEQHKNGRLHIHIIISVGFGKRWLKDNARQCGMGYQVDEKPVNDASKVVGYVVKYLRKNLGKNDWSAGFRRVRTSRGFPKVDYDNQDGWMIVKVSHLRAVMLAELQSGYDVSDKTGLEV